MKRLIVLFLPVLFVGMNLQGATDCVFVAAGSMRTLQASCMTDSSLVVPDGFTMNLNGFTVTGSDPSSGHFLGGVIQKYGGTANVTNGTITVSNLFDVCDAGADRLRGVLFDGASGFITNLKILNIHRSAVLNGCQEGNGIEVRNFGTSPTTVSAFIDGNTVSGYQKTGIVVNGDSYGTVTNNTVSGFGPQTYLAQNGIQIGFGATAQVKKNTVSGNAYTGTSTVSGGIIVVAGPYYGSDYSVGDQIDGNTVTGNDVGVWLTVPIWEGSSPRL